MGKTAHTDCVGDKAAARSCCSAVYSPISFRKKNPMKYVSYFHNGRARTGLIVGSGIVEAGERLGVSNVTDLFERRAKAERLAALPADLSLEDVMFLPAVPNPVRILCVGLNYLSHLKETGRETPARPIIFTRFASSQVGHRQPMLRPSVSDNFDYEGELAVVIGKECRHVERTNAMSVLAGYSCYNDGSIRDWQRHTTQFTPGKNFPATGAFGPWIVSVDEIDDITQSTLITRLNGEEVQRAVVADLVFDIPHLISYCSTFTPLSPGDVIVTGTTGGVGMARKPPLWMKPGETVEVEISGVGTLMNPIGQE